MKYLLVLSLIGILVQLSVAPPVTQNKKDKENEIEDKEELAEFMEYKRYLEEVVEALESDEGFKEKLQKANAHDLRTGKIADHLEFVNHNVRTKLDELKREELERLRHLARKEHNLQNGIDLDHLKIAEHLDHKNEHTFEIQDLKNLIAKTTKDLTEADRRRREEFKQHEMEIKYEEQEKLKAMNEAERLKYEQELKAIEEKHKQHEPELQVHHPGSKQQLEEVWEKQDHMDNEEFNPRTFFYLHDVDGNGAWDQDEVKALFLKELDKLYAQGATYEDLLKRTEEMERMREHVFNESDLNRDGFISYEEFLEQTRKPDFQQDEGWESLDQQQIYTHEEFEAFERHKQEEMQKMIAKGMSPPHQGNIPPHPNSFPPQNVNPAMQGAVPPVQMHQQYPDQQHGQYIPQQQMPIHQQQYPNQVPVQGHDPIAQQQYHPQMPQQPMPGQLPDQHYQQGQIPLQQQQYQGHPNQQQYQGHPNQQQYQGQPPVQQRMQQPQQQQYQQQVQQQQQQPQQPQAPQLQQAHPAQPQQPQQPQPPQPQQPHLSQPQNPQPPQPQPAQQQNTMNQAQQPVQQNPQVPQTPPKQGIQSNSVHTAGKV